jgi:DNA repair protein RecN (Recombination protein N)
LALQKQFEEKLQAVLQIDETIRQKETELTKSYAEANLLAEKISKGRLKQVKPLQDAVNKLLAQVGMPNALLRVTISDLGELHENGKDGVEFLFDANKSGQFQSLRKVASGGELSRLMLCIKSLVAQSIDLPTLIFDEIDTGISGEAARQVGIIMKELAARRQLISITHQPQIAGKADAHFFVYKEIVKAVSPGGRDIVKTNIRLLSTDERITTIAKMLSGEKPTAAAMENAREMLN